MTTKVDRRVFLRGLSYGAIALAFASVPQAAESMSLPVSKDLGPEDLVERAQVVVVGPRRRRRRRVRVCRWRRGRRVCYWR
jgi:hypothetical protein